MELEDGRLVAKACLNVPYGVFFSCLLDELDMLQNPPNKQPHRKTNPSAQNVCRI